MGQIKLNDISYSGGGSNATEIDDLENVSISTPSDGQVLKYNGTNEVWVNDDEESEIDDTATSTDTTWSSSKINTNFNALISDTINVTIGSNQYQWTIFKKGNIVTLPILVTNVTLPSSSFLLGGTIPSIYRPINYRPSIPVGIYQDTGAWNTIELKSGMVIINTNGGIVLNTGSAYNSINTIVGTLTWEV